MSGAGFPYNVVGVSAYLYGGSTRCSILNALLNT